MLSKCLYGSEDKIKPNRHLLKVIGSSKTYGISDFILTIPWKITTQNFGNASVP